jgi:hypothetical protein
LTDELGATGAFPQGKLNADDEGELCCAVRIEKDKVRVDFGPKPIAWLSMDPEAAIEFASTVIDKAMRIKLRGLALLAEAFGETKQ